MFKYLLLIGLLFVGCSIITDKDVVIIKNKISQEDGECQFNAPIEWSIDLIIFAPCSTYDVMDTVSIQKVNNCSNPIHKDK
jgi:hypothetical protein